MHAVDDEKDQNSPISCLFHEYTSFFVYSVVFYTTLFKLITPTSKLAENNWGLRKADKNVKNNRWARVQLLGRYGDHDSDSSWFGSI